VTDAGKQRFDADQAWNLLKDAASVTIAKGKKFERFVPAKDGRETILKAAMGPSGNLRAPTFRVGRDFVIGFNPELYDGWVK
jgi:hypothetical protein